MASAKAAVEKQLQESSFSSDNNGDDDDDEKDQDLSQNLLSPTVPNGTVSTIARQLVESHLTVSTGLDDIYEGAYDNVEGETISARDGDGDRKETQLICATRKEAMMKFWITILG